MMLACDRDNVRDLVHDGNDKDAEEVYKYKTEVLKEMAEQNWQNSLDINRSV